MIFKYIFKTGQRLRNPSIQKWFVFLKKSEKWTLQELEAYQFKKLKELLESASKYSPYYNTLFSESGIGVSDFKKLDDIKKFPIITKEDILKNIEHIPTNLKFLKTFTARTSGTSGQNLFFQRDESADSFNRAAAFRGYSWFNVKPHEYNGYLWGYNFSLHQQLKTKILDRFQNRFRLFSYDKKSVQKFVKKLHTASYIHGYSSVIYEIAKIINKNPYPKPLKLKLVVGTSEKIMTTYQNEIKKAFGKKMVNEYGATESGIIGFECPFGNIHQNMEGVFVEEIDHEIVVTNLQMKSFPIIRYKLGDYIKIAPESKKCKCGMEHTIIEEVTGRVGKLVYGKNHTYPSLYFYYIFKNLNKKHHLNLYYQVWQPEKGVLKFLISQKLSVKDRNSLELEIIEYFKTDIDFEIKDGQLLNFKNNKQQSFNSIL